MKEIIEELVELIESAIKAKDWKVDGVCDPTVALIRAKKAIAEAEKQDGDCQRCGGKGCIACDAREQEPVAWMNKDVLELEHIIKAPIQVCRREPDEYYDVPLYTHPKPKIEQEEPLPPVEIGVDVTADGATVVGFYRRPNAVMEMFYSQFHPQPKREWVGLTDEEIWSREEVDGYDFARAIEAKLKEKNT